jgi:endonuclease YncB( thermonuclease family)
MGLLYTISDWFFPAARTGRSFSGVPYVIDGDTLAFGRKRVRLWGIDAPEMDTWPGKQARLFLIEKLTGQSVTCIETGERSYGRIVAKCYVGGEDIAWWLVNAGHAVDWPRYSGGYYRSGTSHELRRFIIAYRRRYREFAPTRSNRSVPQRR